MRPGASAQSSAEPPWGLGDGGLEGVQWTKSRGQLRKKNRGFRPEIRLGKPPGHLLDGWLSVVLQEFIWNLRRPGDSVS